MSTHEETSAAAANQRMKKVHCVDHANLMLKELTSHYESQQLSDVVLVAGDDGKRVPAHRLVLSASSPYFKAMFTGSLREATENEVTLNDVQGDILQQLVEFSYSGHIELHQDTVELLLIAANLFQINSVVTECSNFLAEQLDPSNCLGMWSLADSHNCKVLRKTAEDYIRKEFMEVCKNEEFLKLGVTQLAELIASDELDVSNEEDVFHSVMEWVNSDLSKRKQHIRELLPLVRMTQLSLAFIVDHLEAVCRSNDCLDIFMNALKWHSLPEKRSEMATEYTKPRNSTLATLLGIGRRKYENQVTLRIECYCPRLDKWTFLNNVNDWRSEFSVAIMGDNLLIVGGLAPNMSVLSSVISMNVTTLAVTEPKAMSSPRFGLCVAVVGNNFYAIGGHDFENALNTVERYDPVTNTWNYVASMSKIRYYAGAAVLNGCIYVVGGKGSNRFAHHTVECYNPSSNTWTDCTPMSVARRSFGIAVSKGVLYVVGGQMGDDETSTAESYDPITDKWTMLESMSRIRSCLGCGFLGKCLMVVGVGLVEEYDLETKKWNTKQSLPERFDCMAICVVPKRYLSNLSYSLE